MPVVGFDHVAITVADVDATVDFYTRVLGAEPLFLDRWRAGEMPVALLQIGAARMSVHPAAAPVSPHADVPTPGSADLCFRYEGAVDDILATLERNRVPVTEARCRGRRRTASVARRCTSAILTTTCSSCSRSTPEGDLS